MTAEDIVKAILGELSKRKGLDIKEIIDDEDIYDEVVSSLIQVIENSKDV